MAKKRRAGRRPSRKQAPDESSADPLVVAANAARGFKVLQCAECVQKIKAALLAAGHSGQVVELRPKSDSVFMICLSYDEGRTAITQNRRHLAVRLGDVVFDNLHPDGLPFRDWLADYDAVGGVQVYSATDF